MSGPGVQGMSSTEILANLITQGRGAGSTDSEGSPMQHTENHKPRRFEDMYVLPPLSFSLALSLHVILSVVALASFIYLPGAPRDLPVHCILKQDHITHHITMFAPFGWSGLLCSPFFGLLFSCPVTCPARRALSLSLSLFSSGASLPPLFDHRGRVLPGPPRAVAPRARHGGHSCLPSHPFTPRRRHAATPHRPSVRVLFQAQHRTVYRIASRVVFLLHTTPFCVMVYFPCQTG